MLKSKSIADFKELQLTELLPGVTLPFALHLYFKATNHVMAWLPAGAIATEEIIERYKSRGLTSVWIHKSELSLLEKYFGANLDTPAGDLVAISSKEASSLDYSVPKGPSPAPEHLVYNPAASAKRILAILRDNSRTDREKGALIAKYSRQLLGTLSSPTSIENQEFVSRSIAATVRDVIVESSPEAKDLADPIWAIAALEPDLNHGINVATFAVLLAMAFGKTDEQLIGGVGVAAMLHDVGMSQIPFELSQTWGDLSHPDRGMELVVEFAPAFTHYSDLIRSHHAEPKAEISQFVAIADEVDSLCKGQVDGKERTVLEALFTLEKSHRFKSGLFSAVLRWIRSNVPEHSIQAAAASIPDQAA